MENLDEIKESVDSWYTFMYNEADKAVQQALEHAAKSIGEDEDLLQ